MSKGVLVDLTKCIGCNSCSVACKLWNGLKIDEENSPSIGPNPILNDINWTTVTFNEVQKDGKPVWRFVKNQCLHCEDPACASACFAKAFQKTEAGPVIYYPHLCVGCRYCMIACPFDIPKFEWDKAFPQVTKCQMCSTKVDKGEAPACVSVCPTNVMTYGDRDELLAKAQEIVQTNSRYVKHIFGEKEVGGTAWIYISDVPFEELGFRTDVTHRPLPEYSHDFLKYTPAVALTWGALLTGLYVYTKRRKDIADENKKDMTM